MRIPSSTTAASPARAGSRKRLWADVWCTLGLIFVCLAIAVLIPSNGYLGAAWTDYVIQQAIGGRGFRLAAWETQAIAEKTRDLATRPGAVILRRTNSTNPWPSPISMRSVGSTNWQATSSTSTPTPKPPIRSRWRPLSRPS